MATKKPVKSDSLTSFRNEHDPALVTPRKIKAALETLGDAWKTEQDFLRSAHVSNANITEFRGQFEAHIVVVRKDGKPRNLWVGNVAIAKEMRKIVGQ